MAAALVVASPASHGVGIYIDGINRIAHCNGAVSSKDVTDVAGIAFSPIRNKNLVGFDFDAKAAIMDIGNLLAQEIISQFRSISAEGC